MRRDTAGVTRLGTDRLGARLDGLAAAGLPLPEFATAALDVLRQALPFTAACLAPVDPATELITATVKWGGLTDDEDDQWAFWEYEAGEAWDFRTTMRRPGGVTSTHRETAGRPERSARHTDFFRATYDFDDELRAALRSDGDTWGVFALFREHGSAPFAPDEQELVSAVAPVFARGMRTALVAGSAAAVDGAFGPAVLVLDAAGRVGRASVGAAARVAALGGGPLGDAPLPFGLRALVGAARAYAEGRHTEVPRMRLRTTSGGWVVAHASPLIAVDGGSPEIVVTIEEARPPEVVPLVVASYGLTGREQQVVQLVLQGMGTAEIATRLHLSAWTVQDHLKAVFAKAGVRSRRELTARVFAEQYVPRMVADAPLAPSGWFAAP